MNQRFETSNPICEPIQAWSLLYVCENGHLELSQSMDHKLQVGNLCASV